VRVRLYAGVSVNGIIFYCFIEKQHNDVHNFFKERLDYFYCSVKEKCSLFYRDC